LSHRSPSDRLAARKSHGRSRDRSHDKLRSLTSHTPRAMRRETLSVKGRQSAGFLTSAGWSATGRFLCHSRSSDSLGSPYRCRSNSRTISDSDRLSSNASRRNASFSASRSQKVLRIRPFFETVVFPPRGPRGFEFSAILMAPDGVQGSLTISLLY